MNSFFHAQNINRIKYIEVYNSTQLLAMMTSPVRDGQYLIMNDITSDFNGSHPSSTNPNKTVPYNVFGNGHRIIHPPQITYWAGGGLFPVRMSWKAHYYGNAKIHGVNFVFAQNLQCNSLTDCVFDFDKELIDSMQTDVLTPIIGVGPYQYTGSVALMVSAYTLTRVKLTNYIASAEAATNVIIIQASVNTKPLLIDQLLIDNCNTNGSSINGVIRDAGGSTLKGLVVQRCKFIVSDPAGAIITKAIGNSVTTMLTGLIVSECEIKAKEGVTTYNVSKVLQTQFDYHDVIIDRNSTYLPLNGEQIADVGSEVLAQNVQGFDRNIWHTTGEGLSTMQLAQIII